MARKRRKSAVETEAGILALKAQGYTRSQIIAAGYPRSTTYKIWPVERTVKDASQITVPLGSAPSPDGESISIRLSHEDFAALGTHPGVVAGMMQAERIDASLRDRILKAVCEDGPFEDVLALMRHIRRPGHPQDNFGTHEMTHIIKSLNSQGLLTFVESRNGTVNIPTRIKATKQGVKRVGLPTYNREVGRMKYGEPQHRGDRTDFRTHHAAAEGGPVEREHVALESAAAPETSPVAPPVAQRAPAPDPGTYPLLDALRGRFAANAEADAKASRYAEAAAVLESIDPARSEELMARAMEVSGTPFTALEVEILRYIEEVTK